MMHDGMQYDPIQGQGQVMSPFRLKSGHFQKLSPLPLTMGGGN